uniref:Ubiquitin-like domain-containing protein n=1 Tax=Anopheles gambiae TaxID=7165 RepID=A0A1S4GYT2_ANOGA
MDVTLIVKASNQQCEDLTIKCEPSWTIRRLKGHLTEVYPGKPSTDEQKLIYSGQLLGDSVVLKDVLRQYDGQQAHTVHLVFTPKNSYYGGSSSSSGSKSNSNSSTKMASNAASSSSSSSTAASAGSSGTSSTSTSTSGPGVSYGQSSREGVGETTLGDGASGDGLRHRGVSQPGSAPRANPRPSQFVEQTAALQAYMHTYMQCLNQYVNLINEQANVNAVQSGGALPGTAGNAAPSTTTPTAYPLSGAQPPFPNVPFMPMVQPTTIPGAFPNLAYYPCMATAPYASGFPSSGNIPATAAAAASSPAGTGASNFLPTTPGLPMPSGQQTPTTTPIAAGASAAAGGEAGDGTATAPGTSGGEVVATAAAEQQGAAGGAPQDGGQAGAGAPARARRFPNIVVEEQENNDWLDVFFSMCRVGILITVIYLYSSPIRCLTVLFIGVMLYLKKHLDRYYQADRRTPRVPPVAQDAAPAREQQEPVAGQPNHNNVPEQNAEQLPAHEPAAAAGTSGTESATKRETSEAGPSSSRNSQEASTSGRTVVPRPRTGPLSQNAEATAAPVTEQDQHQQEGAQAASVASDEHGTAEQPAAEGQRMTFNDMTSFLGTLVITFFTSIIPDTPAA